ncbi:unnamed protein product [Arabis nemorensis]|uniref:Malectin-like domain-containing protein n=1 Tax=Arabis nemorensis TaxID=586526 RepID=A0A565BG92_9BRAS|nr:unnamed protein product [Arabis nemorensis]
MLVQKHFDDSRARSCGDDELALIFFAGSSSAVNLTWPDRFYSTVESESGEKIISYFNLSSGKKNCHVVPLPPVIFSSSNLLRDGSYSDLFAFIGDGDLELCCYSMKSEPKVHVDADFRSALVTQSLYTQKGANQAPNYFPMNLYKTAVTASGRDSLVFELEVDSKLDYMLWFHFSEIDSTVNKAGLRVAPILSGFEIYAIVPADITTVPEQALKYSLGIPAKMGWNGDPCAPISWEAWEGVSCSPQGDSFVISQINIGSKELKGLVSEQIALLKNLQKFLSSQGVVWYWQPDSSTLSGVLHFGIRVSRNNIGCDKWSCAALQFHSLNNSNPRKNESTLPYGQFRVILAIFLAGFSIARVNLMVSFVPEIVLDANEDPSTLGCDKVLGMHVDLGALLAHVVPIYT